MAETSSNICGRLHSVKNRLEKGTKAALSVESALSAIQNQLGKFGKGWMCKGST